MVSAYCLDYHNWVCIPRHVREDFLEMADMGYDTVCLSFSESEMTYARKTFEILVELAHACGLKVHVIPSRIAGRFAGAPLMPSKWLAQHPEFAVAVDTWMPVGCVEAPETREFVKSFMTTLIGDYPIDGIVWDEPKCPTQISHHPATRKRFGDDPTEEDMATGFCEFFREITDHCHALAPHLVQTLFTMKYEHPFFTSQIAKTPHIDYFGYDGNLSRQRKVFRGEVKEEKYRIETVWDRTLSECAAAGKKRFALIETMHMPTSELSSFERNFEEYLHTYTPDHLSVYYYGHNAEDPEALQSVIRSVMKRCAHLLPRD